MGGTGLRARLFFLPMYLFDFNSRLKRLNPHLYVQQDAGAKQGSDFHSHSIRIRRPKREAQSGLEHLNREGRRFMEGISGGHIDEFICGVTSPWVPETEQFDPLTGKLIARGYRSILLALVRKNIVSLDRARRIFNCPSLNEADYDRASFEEKKQRFLDAK